MRFERREIEASVDCEQDAGDVMGEWSVGSEWILFL
jgi:hypothetical protein